MRPQAVVCALPYGRWRHVVAGIEEGQDVDVAVFPLTAVDEVFDATADPAGGDLGQVVFGAEADGVQQLAPGGSSGR
ncbi:hypothetical protein JK360_16345 [Streptomyces sp. 9-7]|uniref:Uncharacterized protein n=1 Tax=Streptomyces siderophoricus TaxID=2802281 RepID=A0ABS1MT41_9ACTN|nr:hypothetical protein [Streptomyces sp. 9-7]